MASKRTKNRLYWALVNAMADKDDAAIGVLERWYIAALMGSVTDTEILSVKKVQKHLGAMEELHGPAGVRQLKRGRPIEIRQYVDQLREEFER